MHVHFEFNGGCGIMFGRTVAGAILAGRAGRAGAGALSATSSSSSPKRLASETELSGFWNEPSGCHRKKLSLLEIITNTFNNRAHYFVGC